MVSSGTATGTLPTDTLIPNHAGVRCTSAHLVYKRGLRRAHQAVALGGDLSRVWPPDRTNTKACRASQTEPSRLGQMDKRFEADGKGLPGGQ